MNLVSSEQPIARTAVEAENCKSPEDILAFAKKTGYKLTDEQLEAVSDGDSWWECKDYCPPTFIQ